MMIFWEPSVANSCWSSRARVAQLARTLLTQTLPLHRVRNNNNNNPIWGGSVLTGEELPPHCGELNHALSPSGGPNQTQPSHPMSSGHHISLEHRPRRKQLNSDTNASNKTYLKEIQEKIKRRNFFSEKNEKMKKQKKIKK